MRVMIVAQALLEISVMKLYPDFEAFLKDGNQDFLTSEEQLEVKRLLPLFSTIEASARRGIENWIVKQGGKR